MYYPPPLKFLTILRTLLRGQHQLVRHLAMYISGMLTHRHGDGQLHSHPLTTQNKDGDEAGADQVDHGTVAPPQGHTALGDAAAAVFHQAHQQRQQAWEGLKAAALVPP
mgnify:CR=1 FL=1